LTLVLLGAPLDAAASEEAVLVPVDFCEVLELLDFLGTCEGFGAVDQCCFVLQEQ
jgi:hypothetical protein